MPVHIFGLVLDGGRRQADHSAMTRAATGPRLRPDKNEATRRRLLGAALKVVGRHGYAGTSIGRITRRARVALGTFYTHFGSQQDLFDQLLPHLGEQLLAAIRLRLAGMTDTGEREAAGFDTFFEFLAEYPEFYRVLNEAEIFAPRAHAAHLENMLQGYLRAFGQASARGELAGFSEAEFEPVIYMLLGARQYLAMRYPASAGTPPGHPPPAVREAYLKVFSGGLLSRDRGPDQGAVPIAPVASAENGAARARGALHAGAAPAAALVRIRFSGDGLRRVVRAELARGDVSYAGSSLLATMEALAYRLLDDGAGDVAGLRPRDWADVHFQRPAAGATLLPAAGIRLSASLRADGALVEVCAHDAERRLLAICGFRPASMPYAAAPVSPSVDDGRPTFASEHDDTH